MKKLTTPMLLAIFALCFSGKPAPQPACGPLVIITDVDQYFFGITRVVVYNWTTGTTTYYNNPTFPINHIGQGTQLQVQFYFDAPYHGAINLDNPCQMVNFHDQSIVSINFTATCNNYRVELIPGTEDTHYTCP